MTNTLLEPEVDVSAPWSDARGALPPVQLPPPSLSPPSPSPPPLSPPSLSPPSLPPAALPPAALLAPSLPPPRPPRRVPRQRLRAFFVATVAVSTVAGGLAGWWAQSRTSSPSATVATTSPASSLTTGPAVSPTSLAPTSTTVPTNATLAGQGLSVAEVLAKVGPAVVNIEATVVAQVGPRQVSGTSAGTGIVLTADGKVLTNAHVVANATSMTVALPGESTAREATVLLRDSEADVAVLQITGASGLATAPLGIDAKVAVGDDVVAVGNALALEGGPTVTRGIVSALDRTIETSTTTLQHLIQTDAAISSGDSGGPLVNAAGQVIGLDTAGASSSSSVMAENMGFAIPIGQAMDVVEAAGILLT